MNTHRRPSILAPIDPAWAAMKQILFRPFNPNLWVGMGFTAWLACLGKSGCSADIPLDPKERGDSAAFLRGVWTEYSAIILYALVVLAVVAVIATLVMTWLRCRGAFMFLDNAIHRRGEIVGPWSRTRELAHSLFLWTLGFAFVALVALAIPLAPLLMLKRGITAWTLPLAIGLSAPLLLVWCFAILYIRLFLNDFITPLMWRNNIGTRQAWREFKPLFLQAPLTFIGYGLFKAALDILFALAVFLGGCLTCCCLFIVLALPFIWAVVLLPILLFMRLYSLEFLRQFGSPCDVWATASPPALPPPPPATEEEIT